MKEEEVGEKPMHGPFNAALAQASGGAVMVPRRFCKPKGSKSWWCGDGAVCFLLRVEAKTLFARC